MESIINNHNLKTLNNTAEIVECCNCRNRNNCSLDGKCLTLNIIYKAQITPNQSNYKEKIYKGITETDSKADLTATQNDSTPNTMKTTWNYLKNIGQ